MSDFAVRVGGLGKLYRIGERGGYRTLRDAIGEGVAGIVRRALPGKGSHSEAGNRRRSATSNHIWALKDVSFEIGRGEVVGIIGPNGAGKTTLLKILSRITEPTTGQAVLCGRVGSLLEVGTGFHPEMTGRENIYLNGAILGMTRHEIDKRFDEIVAFAGVEEFLATPVKRYSSGMYMRLAFSVAAHLEPEIFLVDEVLAVGDARFQEKCVGKLGEIAQSGRTVLFVSHNMAAIRSLCSRAVLLDHGQVTMDDRPNRVISAYLSPMNTGVEGSVFDLAGKRERSGRGSVRITSFEARVAGEEADGPRTGEDVEFIIGYEASSARTVRRLHVGISLMDAEGVTVLGCTTRMWRERDLIDVAPNGRVVCRIKELPLVPGRYWVSLLLKDEMGLADMMMRAVRINVVDGGNSGFLVLPSRAWGGSVVVRHQWEWRPLIESERVKRLDQRPNEVR